MILRVIAAAVVASVLIRQPASGASDPALKGEFAWVDVNGKAAPQEFPAGSRTILVGGRLHFADSTAAARRFTLGFTFKPTPNDTARSVSHGGTFRVSRDTIDFRNDGRENVPVIFLYKWRSADTLALTDSKGHVWGYVRRK
jgi:hypothetical protein